VQARTRPTVLPPDLFSRFDNDAFWNDPVRLPHTVRVI
jgi:sulfotransferase